MFFWIEIFQWLSHTCYLLKFYFTCNRRSNRSSMTWIQSCLYILILTKKFTIFCWKNSNFNNFNEYKNISTTYEIHHINHQYNHSLSITMLWYLTHLIGIFQKVIISNVIKKMNCQKSVSFFSYLSAFLEKLLLIFWS